ncbi:proton myo-inositol cotransporter-like [Pollicipes pollicipes]|uniref:proton myo-inositol cotransporter-like n=1 Tax=Pollicipes pollicipes TaxID=41117 RepID=UPI001885955E|nr:proton myo-inositol cotransporter-like [Pollicipes pollicipes]
MTVPICVPESAPAASRGLLGTLTEAANHLVGFAFMSQTPRLLISRGRDAQAHDVRHRIRGGGKHVQDEHEAIKADLDEQEQVLRDPTTRRRAHRLLLQLFQQVSGVNTVIYYSANITTLAGVRDMVTAIWLSSMTILPSVLAKSVSLTLVDLASRRPILLRSTLAPATCTCTCVCGFCFRNLAAGPANGSCMPIVSSHNSSEAAGRGADTAALGVGGLTWAPNWRPIYAWLPITGMLLYITPFSPGLGAMPWTITVESFPVWARSTCISITTAVNWSFNLLVSLTFLPLAHSPHAPSGPSSSEPSTASVQQRQLVVEQA